MDDKPTTPANAAPAQAPDGDHQQQIHANNEAESPAGNGEADVTQTQQETADVSWSATSNSSGVAPSQRPADARPSKKAKERQEKKYKKKVAQAQATVLRAEGKQYAELINLNDRPSARLIVTHFGNGDEID